MKTSDLIADLTPDVASNFQSGLNQVSDIDGTFSLTLKHLGTPGTDPAIQFGLFDSYGFNALASSDPNAEITCSTVPYTALLEYLKANAVLVSGMKIQALNTSSVAALTRDLRFFSKTIGGSVKDDKLSLVNFQASSNFRNDIIDMPNFKFVISGDMGMQYKLEAGESVNLTFYVKRRGNQGLNVVTGNAVEENDKGYISGNPVIAMLKE